MSSFHL